MDYLYGNYSGALYGVIIRIVKKEEVAEEVLQDVFLKIWDKIENYDASKGKLFTWMINITRNHAIDKLRSKEINKEQKTKDIANLVSRVETEQRVEQHTDHIGINETLTRLPEDQRFVVDYLYLKGYTQSELAKEFKIPLGTIKSRLRMAMQQLRITLGIT